MSDDFSTPPEWLHQAKVFWDTTGRTHALPIWPPKEVSSRVSSEPTRTPRPNPRMTSGVIRQSRALPKELLLYYVDAPKTDERWVPLSPVMVQALTELAAQQGMALDWRAMPPTVSAEQVMRRTHE